MLMIIRRAFLKVKTNMKLTTLLKLQRIHAHYVSYMVSKHL